MIAWLALIGAIALLIVLPTSAALADTEFGLEGSTAGEFSEPHGIVLSRQRSALYVGDRNNQRLDAFSESGSFLSAWGWGVADGQTEALQSCAAVCFAGTPGEGAGQFNFPEGVAVDNDPLSSAFGDLYVADSRDHRVQVFNPEGEFELMFGRNVLVGGGDVCHRGESCRGGEGGEAPGALEAGEGAIAVAPDGSVVVGDVNRLELFGVNGVFTSEVSLPGTGVIRTLAIDDAGHYYVTTEGASGVHEFNGSGVELGEPRDAGGSPAAITVGPAEELYVVDAAGEEHHVLEFDAAGKQISSFDRRARGRGESAGIAANESGTALYVGNAEVIRVITSPPPGPLIVAGSATAGEVTPTTAEVGGIVNSEGEEGLQFHFEYGTTTSYGTQSSPEPLSASFEDQQPQASLTALLPATVYHYRLVVENSKSEVVATGADATFATLPSVTIEAVIATDVTSISARLLADVTPHATRSSFHFDYGTTTAYGLSAPVPDGELGEPTAEVSITIQHLTPSTRYHYRIVTDNKLGESVSSDATFVTQAAGPMPQLDARSWEMVSPSDKEGASLEGIAGEGGLIQAASSGDRLTYFSQTPIAHQVEGSRAFANSQLLAERTEAGWKSEDISVTHEVVTPLIPGYYSEYLMFSNDLSVGAIEPAGATPLSTAASEKTPYERKGPGLFEPLVNPTNVAENVEFGGIKEEGQFLGGVKFITASPDLRYAALVSPQPLTPKLPAAGGTEVPNVFEWHDGVLELASVMPNGKAASAEGLSAFVGRINNAVNGAVSDDGSRVVFTINTGGQEQIYLRDMRRKETVQVDAPESGAAAHVANSEFQFASGDGKRVFFLDSRRLTRDATAREGKPDLYMCEVQTSEGLSCRLEDLTVASTREAADVQGAVVAMDREAGFIYFVADARLAGGATSGDCETTANTLLPAPSVRCNLYVRDVAHRETHLVAVLAGRDQNDWAAIEGFDFGGTTARVSPNGRYLAFMSQLSLTGFDNRDAHSGMLDEEVFLYDRVAGSLTCVSCASNNSQPTGIFDANIYPGLLVDRPGLWEGQTLAASIPGWTKIDTLHSLYASRVLSDSGRMFFNSATPLVPQDTNGREDVYEYEPDGQGSCREEGGCVGLISSGDSGEESAFLDASEGGDDVFFLTAARLFGTDTDKAFDIYDARACPARGGCLTAPPEAVAPCATRSACQPAIIPPEESTSVGTETPSGAAGAVSGGGVGKAKSVPTRAAKYAAALRRCKKLHAKARRRACVRTAKRQFGPHPRKPAQKGGHR